MKFSELNIDPLLKKGIDSIGYQTMTPIQEQSIQPILDGRDLMGLAKTGSGKTSACAIPVLEKIDHALMELQILILVPTRELAFQYCDEIDRLSKYLGTKVCLLYGGVPMGEQRVELESAQLAVATPGRFIDHIYSSNVSMRHIKCFVLDEADEMLNMGFMEDVDFILSCMGHKHQKLLFSATMPAEIDSLAQNQLSNPVQVKLISEEKIPETIDHYFVQTSSRNRIECLLKYMEEEAIVQAILFCNSRINVEKLHEILKKRLRSIEMIHGGLPQNRRTSIFERFKKKRVKFMIATDVAGRGLDFSHVTHVVNYDFPMDLESFTHRTGRTGRMGKKGKSLTFIPRNKTYMLRQIQNKIGVEPIWLNRHLTLLGDNQYGPPGSELKSDEKHTSLKSKNKVQTVEEKPTTAKSDRALSKGGQESKRRRRRKRKGRNPETVTVATGSRPRKTNLVNSIKKTAKKLWDRLF